MTWNWTSFLEELSAELLRDDIIRERLKAEGRLEQAALDRWLEFPGAHEAEIQAAETRLGTTLPSSYRSFLMTTNGWANVDFFVDRMLPIQEITWYRDSDAEFIEPWIRKGEPDVPDGTYLLYGEQQDVCAICGRYLRNCLKISNRRDDTTLLLNPEIKNAEGEWEAWHFGWKLPGAFRYRSFYDLMQAKLDDYRSFYDLMQAQLESARQYRREAK